MHMHSFMSSFKCCKNFPLKINFSESNFFGNFFGSLCCGALYRNMLIYDSNPCKSIPNASSISVIHTCFSLIAHYCMHTSLGELTTPYEVCKAHQYSNIGIMEVLVLINIFPYQSLRVC